MSDFEETINSLEMRARYGKTATLLIDSARQTIREHADDYRQLLSDRDAEIQKISGVLQETSRVNRILEEERDRLRKENEELRKPRKEVSVNGDTVRHVLIPAEEPKYIPGSGEKVGLWRLDELDAALVHLAVAGAAGDTQVRISNGNLHVKLKADGTIPTGWEWKLPEPKIIRKTPWWVWGIAFGSSAATYTIGLALGLLSN